MQKSEVRRSSRAKRSTTAAAGTTESNAGTKRLSTDAGTTDQSNSDTMTRYPCAVCPKSYSRLDNLRVHERAVHGKVKVKCMTCKKQFSSHLALRKHEVTHSEDRPHRCSVCDMRFKRVDAMRTHQRDVHECRAHKHKTFWYRREDEKPPIKCEYRWCKKRFDTSVGLERHMEMHNTGTSVHWTIVKQCPWCSSSSVTPKFHQLLLSPTAEWQWHQCTLCLKVYDTCKSLDKHKDFQLKDKRRGGFDIYQCTYGKQIVEIGAQCQMCWKLFSSKQSLKKHKLTQHNDTTVLYLKQNEQNEKVDKDTMYWKDKSGGYDKKRPAVDWTLFTRTKIHSYLATRTNISTSVASSSVASSSVASISVATSSVASSPVSSKRRGRPKKKGFRVKGAVGK